MSDRDRVERRRVHRRPVLESFSLFVVVPKKGIHRLKVHDVSNLGIGFDVDIEGESFDDFPVVSGEKIDVNFYLNQSLYLSLNVQVARVEHCGSVRRIGGEFTERESKGYQAFVSFLQMLDTVVQAARFDA